MTTVAQLFPSKYVAASDVAVPVQVVIERIDMEDVGKEKERLPVVYFTGKQKGLVLNRTNANRIAEAHGQEITGWLGQTITLYASETDFAGKTVPCVRVRLDAAVPPQPAQQHLEPAQAAVQPPQHPAF